jgi:DNA-directed RNA polymerase subunit beta
MPVPEPSNSILSPSTQSPLTTREFGDVNALRGNLFNQARSSAIEVAPFEPKFTRQGIFDGVVQQARSIKPIQNDLYTLSLHDVDYEGPESFTKKDHKQAILSHTSLSRKLRGTWQLTDNATGKAIANKRATIANVPYLTEAGTFVNNGVEYTLAHQMRLRAGVYTREKDNGELEAHVNVLPGKGRMHRYFLDPKTGVFKINIGQANIPLMPALKAMGVSEQDIRSAWGNELTAVNMEKGDAGTVDKLYNRLVYKPVAGLDPEGKQKAIAEEFARMELDPDVTKRTLGAPIKNLTPDAILSITKKLIAVNRKEAEPDDRDSMAFQQVFGPEDLIAERFTKDRAALRQLLWKATAKKTLDHLPTGVFNKAITAALVGSGLGSSLEEINPAEIFDHQARVTRLGEGGIGSLDAVPVESRSVQPSQFGFVDYLRTPESGKVGVDMRFARGALKGSDGKIYMQVKNLKTGELEYKSPQDIADIPLAFPGEDKTDLPSVAAIVNGKLKYIPREEAQYMAPSMDSSLSALSNMVPMKSMMKGHRVIMGSRMFTQALPLANAEAPFIQSGTMDDPTRSYEDEMGKNLGAIHSDGHAQVVSVSPDEIVLRDKDGNKRSVDLYNDAPFNRKTFWTQKPTVQPGDTVKPGQLLATSNFTDKNGTAALGANMRVGYLPFKGVVYDDSIVISESAAKRLTSEHMYQHEAEADDNTHIDKKKFISLFPQEYDKKVLDNFDSNGVIRKGTTVNYGDPLLLVSKARETTYGQVFRGKSANFTNDSVTWEHHAPGIVTDIAKTKKGYSVVVKNQAQMEVGDKLTGRFGDKGVVAAVIPDDEMPKDAQDRPLEVLVSPLGLASRINPSQIIEAALGKVVEKTGQPYKIQDFDSSKDLIQYAKDELRKHGMSDLEGVTDPETGRKIKDVLVGNRFFMKLHHTAEAKAQGRSTGGYTAEGAPAKGGETGSKRIGTLDLGALLSHGAGQVIRDAKMVRGQANPDYWAQFMAGYSAPLPKIPQVYNKFVEQLRGAGINTVRQGTKTNIMALTDKDIEQLAGDREIQNSDTVDWKAGMRPKNGGLFDERLTGGHNGNRWSKVTLHEPMPNPVMEEPIRRVLGLTENKFRDVLAGREQLGDATGPAAIKTALSRINVPKAIEQARQDIQSGRQTLRDAAVRRLGFLKSADKTGVHPENWMLTKMPVIPPAFRPVSTMGQKKMPLVADANYLYKELLDSNNALKEASGVLSDTGDARLGLYDSMKGVTGLGDPTQTKNVERRVRGFLTQIFGNSPKYGTVQRKLISSTVDLVGRAVITPNSNLDMDQVALPEEKAWEIYKPFVVRGLVRRGLPRMEAVRAFDEKNKAAYAELQTQMGSRPIIINRAPVLHRYGMMAFYPQLTKNKVMEVSPLVTRGFGADFDGDAMQFHVPSTDEAAKEATEKMLPSKNLFAASTFKAHYTPVAEYQSGLYVASNRINKKAPAKVFRNSKDAIAAYRRGDIEVDTPVHIVEQD